MDDTLLDSRVRRLNTGTSTGSCVFYIMSRDQRVYDNHALLAAQKRALQKKLPLAVVFCLQPKTGLRAREHYEFMLAGFAELESRLAELQIPFMILIGDTMERLSALFYHVKPDAVYFDFNPLRGPRTLHEKVAKQSDFDVFEVDTHNIVPVWVASTKQEVGARTLRPKIHRLLAEYLVDPGKPNVHPYAWQGPIIKFSELRDLIVPLLELLPRNGQNLRFKSGETAAQNVTKDFINNRLESYAEDRNNPTKNGLSGLSPYLHFGQLASLRVALSAPNSEVLLEEMVVRKELSDNFCFYNQAYDKLSGAATWAQATLGAHTDDHREFIYTRQQLEQARTHDAAWNAAQLQMVHTGKMHGYMRMYWAKKVLEWSKTPQVALDTLIYLNDFYSLDGGDPNGYVGILWSIAGVHDRAWSERPIFGKIRYMNYVGLKRKFSISDFIAVYLTNDRTSIH